MADSSAPPAAPSAPSEPYRGTQRRRRPRQQPTAPQQQQQQENASPQTQPSNPSRRGGRTNRGRGRGRGQGPTSHGNTSRPQTEGTDAVPEATGEATTRADRSSTRRGRGGRQNPRFPPRTAAGGRQFGGQLTAQQDSSVPAASGLQADAPTFQPGQPIVSREQCPPTEAKTQAPKSTAPDLPTRIHEDILNGHYECAICTEEVTSTASGIWSCRTCWTVFHLSCIETWSVNALAAAQQAAQRRARAGQVLPAAQWRCPGCNLPKDEMPRRFACWCEKELNPKPLSGIPPFSCGQTCARRLGLEKKCPHPCPSICHAGPCPPCNLMGLAQQCHCGSNSVTRRCIEGIYEKGWSCEDVCGRPMSCGMHYCLQNCHSGPCGPCEIPLNGRCYCGKEEKVILCRNMDRSAKLHISIDGITTTETWRGAFECTNVGMQPYTCRKHIYEQPCRKSTGYKPQCPLSPDVVTHCICGKTPLKEISSKKRTSCEDPVPRCKIPCGQPLKCGHTCETTCHQGECSPCSAQVSISCRCGRTQHETVCHQGTEERPQCRRVCRTFLNCKRHECGEHCCPGEPKASKRLSGRRKHLPLDPRNDGRVEPEHICTRICGKPLKCGNSEHRCPDPCHRGPCKTCIDGIFDELSCHCGRTVLYPPLPCGTSPPHCRFQCERPKACGHPPLPHGCHQDTESCPICPFLTTKSCLCGKNKLKNQPCWLTEVRCGDICGRTLRCGVHKCQKSCHREGECNEPCKQACGKQLSVCGHPCTAPCHVPSTCKEEKPCQHKILITCECQRIKQEVKCNASKDGEGNVSKTLKCDEECARLERNRKLALALNVDPEHQTDHIPYSTETLNMYQDKSTWVAGQEKILRLFAADPEENRLRLKPMPRPQRALIHSLAKDFGFDTESMDPEPHRHVVIFKTPKFVMAPMRTLADCLRTRQIQQRLATALGTTSISLRPKPSNTTVDPYNGFLVTDPRFALTIDEVRSAVRSVLTKTSFRLELEVNFLPNDAIALMPPLAARVNIQDREMQTMLESIKMALAEDFTNQKLGALQLARFDSSLNILRRESVSSGSDWSQVAAAKGAPRRTLQPVASIGSRGGYAVLSLSTKKKAKAARVDIAEDWEAAEEEEEQKEKASEVEMAASEDEDGAGAFAEAQESAAEAKGARAEEIVIPTQPSGSRWADMDDD